MIQGEMALTPAGVSSETPVVVLVGEAEETRVTRVVIGVDIKADEFMIVFVADAVARVVLVKSTAAKMKKYMIQCRGNTGALIPRVLFSKARLFI